MYTHIYVCKYICILPIGSLVNPDLYRTLTNNIIGNFPGSPVVKTLPSSVGGVDLIAGWGTKIPHTLRPKNQYIKQKQYCKKFNKDFKNVPHLKKKPVKL